MKKLIYTTVITIACVSSIPVSLVTLSSGSAAYAAETCQATSGQATTGGAIREHLTAIANCRSTKPQNSASEVSLSQVKRVTSAMSGTNSVKSDKSDSSLYPAYCSFLPRGVEPGDFSYREAFYRCRYGS